MAYPHSALPVVVEIAPGANSAGSPGEWPWVDVSDRWRVADGITISEGRGDWGAKSDPGSIALTFDNRTGDFSEYNPLGQWYGSLGRDTPLRVRLRYGEDTFSRTSASGLGTSDSGQAWTSTAPSVWSVGSGHGTAAIPVVNSIRRVLYGATLLDAERRLTITPSLALTGASLVWRSLFRYVDTSNYYACSVELDRNTGSGLTVTCKIRRVTTAGGTVEIAVAAPVPGLLYTAGQPVHTRAGCSGATLGVKAWVGTLADEPAGWSCEVDDYAFTEPGMVGEEVYLAFGSTNAVPYSVQLDDYALFVDLAGGFVPAWVPRWDRSRNDRTVPVVAKGVLYRTAPATGKTPARSPYRRTIQGANPAAYWPVEDGTAAGQAGSAISGHPPLTVSGTVPFEKIDATSDFYLSTSTYGTSAMADLSQGGSLSAPIPGDVTAACASAWTALAVARVDYSTISADVVLLDLATPGGTYARWTVVISGTAGAHTKVIAYSPAGAASTLIDTSTTFVLATFALSLAQVGGNIAVDLYLDDDTPHASTGTAGTLAGPTSIGANTTRSTSSIAMPIGHLAAFPNADGIPYPAGTITDIYGNHPRPVRLSWRGEAATDRLLRQAAEDDTRLVIPVLPSADAVVLMGDQPIGTPRDLYQQTVDADGGVLFERPFRLQYTPRESLYNQAAALTLSSEQLGEEPEPDATDQAYRNRIEVKRTDASFAVAEAPEVANGAIVYDDSVELNLATDVTLADQAGWRLRLAATRGLRWPKLKLNLAATPELIENWLNCRPGSRITITDPPDDVAGQDIDVLLEGHTTVLGYKDWDVTGNFSPAGVWSVAEADGEQRAAADGSTLGTGGLALGGMSFQLTSTAANGVWTTDVAEFPLDVNVGGERVTLSAISGASSPQTATVSARGVNGVTKTHLAGTSVDVWLPAIAAL